jgi:hypothetical protein
MEDRAIESFDQIFFSILLWSDTWLVALLTLGSGYSCLKGCTLGLVEAKCRFRELTIVDDCFSVELDGNKTCQFVVFSGQCGKDEELWALCDSNEFDTGILIVTFC